MGLVYTGIAFGFLTAVVDVVLVFALEPALLAAGRETAEEEARFWGGPVDDNWSSGVTLAQVWFVIALASTVLIGLAALVAARRTLNGNSQARSFLRVLSVFVSLWALVPCFDVFVGLIADPDEPVGATLLALAGVKRLGLLSLAIPTAILLARR